MEGEFFAQPIHQRSKKMAGGKGACRDCGFEISEFEIAAASRETAAFEPASHELTRISRIDTGFVRNGYPLGYYNPKL
jgi:hypothetical protein